jgi:hypothetical protein
MARAKGATRGKKVTKAKASRKMNPKAGSRGSERQGDAFTTPRTLSTYR